MRDRLEDLGRIFEKLALVFDSKIFEPTYLHGIDKENIELRIDDLAIEIENLKSELDKIWEIASGQDYLNEEP